MPLTDATLLSLGNSLVTLAPYIALHSADPGTTGANPCTSARVLASWAVDADGDLTCGPKAFTGGAASGPVLYVGLWSAITAGTFRGGAASGPVLYVGLWSAITAGTFRGGFAITGDLTFNSTGDYTLTLVTVNGTST